MASGMIVSVDTPTSSLRDDSMDCGVRRSELNPGSHLTAVGTKPPRPPGDLRMTLGIQGGASRLQPQVLAPACCHLPTFCDLPVTAGVLAILQPHGHTRLSREGMLHRHKGRCTLNTTFETAVGIRGLVCDQGTELNYLPHPSVTAKSWPPPSKELTKTMTIDSQHLTAILSSLTSDPHPQARQRGK